MIPASAFCRPIYVLGVCESSANGCCAADMGWWGGGGEGDLMFVDSD